MVKCEMSDTRTIVILCSYFTFAFAGAAVPHIVAGSEARKNAHPWLLSIETYPGRHHCGASLLRVREGVHKSDIGLTAAHCMCGTTAAEKRFADWFVLAGKHLVMEVEEGQRRRIVGGECLPCWNKSVNILCDAAVFKLSSPIQFDKTVGPIDLPDEFEQDRPGEECVVAGWGAAGLDGPMLPKAVRILQELKVNVQPADVCLHPYRKVFKPEAMICAKPSAKPGTPCVGDSGGPLSCRRRDKGIVQKGIVSFGQEKCNPIYPSSFTRVQYYRKWIVKMKDTLTSL